MALEIQAIIIPTNNCITILINCVNENKLSNDQNACKLNIIRPTQEPKNNSSFMDFGSITPIPQDIANNQNGVPLEKTNNLGLIRLII
tara:strand:- start:601 stop:864 length:264 start_codon:yes stop_codon:yes gene_type:complete